MIGRGLLVVLAAMMGTAGAAEPQGKAPAKKLRVVVFGAHCDDPESGAGGLTLLLTRSGKAIWDCHDAMHRRRGVECGVAYAEAYWLVEAKPGAALLPVKFLKKKP